MKDIPFDALAAFGALVYAVSMFTDNVIGRQWSSVIKQGKTWVIGVGAALFAAHVQFTDNWTISGIGFHQLTLWSQVFFGLTGAFVGNVVFHVAQRFDTTGSGDTPDMPVKAKRKLVRNLPTTEHPKTVP